MSWSPRWSDGNSWPAAKSDVSFSGPRAGRSSSSSSSAFGRINDCAFGEATRFPHVLSLQDACSSAIDGLVKAPSQLTPAPSLSAPLARPRADIVVDVCESSRLGTRAQPAPMARAQAQRSCGHLAAAARCCARGPPPSRAALCILHQWHAGVPQDRWHLLRAAGATACDLRAAAHLLPSCRAPLLLLSFAPLISRDASCDAARSSRMARQHARGLLVPEARSAPSRPSRRAR